MLSSARCDIKYAFSLVVTKHVPVDIDHDYYIAFEAFIFSSGSKEYAVTITVNRQAITAHGFLPG